MLTFNEKIVVITGGARGIGKCMADEFCRAGAKVCVIDILDNDYFVGDLASKADLESFAKKVIDDFGRVDVLINNAAPLSRGISECSYEDFEYAVRVGVTAPFYLSKLFMPYFSEGASIINISSSRDRMSQPETESYTSAKGGISALTHALAVSLAGRVRVNLLAVAAVEAFDAEVARPILRGEKPCFRHIKPGHARRHGPAPDRAAQCRSAPGGRRQDLLPLQG